MVDNSNQEVKPPFRMSGKGAVYCKWEDLPNDISSQLKKENGFTTPIGNFSYYVRENPDGSYIVFRNLPGNYRYASTRMSVGGPYREFQVFPLEEANKLLASSNEFEPVGTDPVKVIDHQFFVVLGKKEKV